MSREMSALEREANATIKLVLIHMEQLASMQPAEASEPYSFEERRQQIMRKIWSLVKIRGRHEPTVL